MIIVRLKENKEVLVIIESEFDSNIHLELINSVENWKVYGVGKTDYMVIRRAIRDIVSSDGFSNIKSKQIVAEYCATDPNTLVGYYMGLGLPMEDAIIKYKENRANDIRRASEAAELRVNSNAFTVAIIKYLSEDDGQTFIDATRNFIIDFKTIALTGINYGNSIDGIMDYIESTNNYVNGGLKNYPIVAPYTLTELITDLKEIIVYGNY